MKNMDVKILPMGSMKELKDMGLDPAAVEQISKKMMEQLFGKRKKKKSDDDDDEDQSGSSFYMWFLPFFTIPHYAFWLIYNKPNLDSGEKHHVSCGWN